MVEQEKVTWKNLIIVLVVFVIVVFFIISCSQETGEGFGRGVQQIEVDIAKIDSTRVVQSAEGYLKDEEENHLKLTKRIFQEIDIHSLLNQIKKIDEE